MIADFGHSGGPILFGIGLLLSPTLVLFVVLLFTFKKKIRGLSSWRKVLFAVGLFLISLVIWLVLLAGIFQEEIGTVLS